MTRMRMARGSMPIFDFRNAFENPLDCSQLLGFWRDSETVHIISEALDPTALSEGEKNAS